MIGPLDAITLARTKIRSKRLRLLITTVVSALVFGVMAGATVLFDGMASSLTAFGRQNLKGQYLVQGAQNPARMYTSGPMTMAPNDPTLIAEVQAIHATYVAERKAAAKRLGITDYDERSEIPPVVDDPNPGVPAEYRRTVNHSSVAYGRWLKAKLAEMPVEAADAVAFQALVAPYGATRVYEARNLAHLQLRLLVDGKEDLTKVTNSMAAGPTAEPTAQDKVMQTALGNGSFTVVDDQLVQNYLVAPNAAREATQGVPVLVTVEDALAVYEKSLSLPKRPTSPKEQIQWFTSVRDKVNGATFISCYRNAAEQGRVEQARVQANEKEANKNNRDWVRPSLELALPTSPCGMVTVARDVRTNIERYAEASRLAFDREFTPQEEPLAEPVTFQIVGLLPSTSPTLSGVDSVLASMLSTNFGFGAVIPEQLWQSLPTELRHEALFAKPAQVDPTSVMWGGNQGDTHLAAFPTVDKARSAVRANSCTMNWSPVCETMPFQLATYGSNYLAVDDITTQLRPAIITLLIITFTIATIIIWAMMGRVIADSRRETAVFRAIGAKRSDIVAVYLTYSLWVALRIVAFAALIGAAIAIAIEVLYADRATTIARLAYGVFTDDPTFTFIGLRSPVLWGILGGIVAMTLVAITPPLLRNIRRNPIKDMRDE